MKAVSSEKTQKERVGLRFMSTVQRARAAGKHPQTQDGKLQTFAKSQGTWESEGWARGGWS